MAEQTRRISSGRLGGIGGGGDWSCYAAESYIGLSTTPLSRFGVDNKQRGIELHVYIRYWTGESYQIFNLDPLYYRSPSLARLSLRGRSSAQGCLLLGGVGES
jgi:hypothetical protein